MMFVFIQEIKEMYLLGNGKEVMRDRNVKCVGYEGTEIEFENHPIIETYLKTYIEKQSKSGGKVELITKKTRNGSKLLLSLNVRTLVPIESQSALIDTLESEQHPGLLKHEGSLDKLIETYMSIRSLVRHPRVGKLPFTVFLNSDQRELISNWIKSVASHRAEDYLYSRREVLLSELESLQAEDDVPFSEQQKNDIVSLVFFNS